MRSTGPAGHHHPRGFATHRLGAPVRAVQAMPGNELTTVKPCCFHANQQLAWAGLGHRQVFVQAQVQMACTVFDSIAAHHRPLNAGRRFSMKARRPSA